MLNRVLTYGALAGLAVGAMLYATTLTWMWVGVLPSGWGMALGYATMLIALSAVFVAIKRQRDEEGGGVIRFWPAFGLGLGISAVASLFYVLAWEAALATTAKGFMDNFAAASIAQKRAAGLSGDELARFAAEMKRLKASYANPLFRLPMTFAEIFPVGVLVSLLSAALLRNPRFLPAERAATNR